MKSRRLLAGTLALLGACHAAVAASPVASPPDRARGELLYDVHCIGCHTGGVHMGKDRQAVSFDDMRRSVRRWSAIQHLDWRDQDVDDVSAFLDGRYYHFGAAAPVP